jgi:CRP-like cAMP-binding protein
MLTQLTLHNIVQPSPEQLYTIADFYYNTKQFNQAVFGFYQYIKACPNGEFVDTAKQRFTALKPKTQVVHLEPIAETLLTYPKDTMIFSECQSGHDMFIIQEGKVKFSKVVNDNEVILAVLQKGDFFGEMALLENKPRSASAIAFEDCRLMVVNRHNFDQMVQSQSQLIARLTTTLSERLWSMNRNLINTQIIDPIMKLLDMLAIQVEKAKVPLAPGTMHQLDITPYDLANMCGMPKERQALHMVPFLQDSHVRLVGGKILVTDCADLVKVMAFYRSKNQKRIKFP